MKTLFLECNMGAAGDMLLAALLELDPNPKDACTALNQLSIPGVQYLAEPSVKCGILGTHMQVTINGVQEQSHDHHHDPNHSHDHEHGHDHSHDHEHGHDHSHEHGHSHDHSREHGHDHSHDHDHSHGHGHAQAQHHHSGLVEIEAMTAALCCSDAVKQRVLAVYHLIAEAESKAHGHPVEQIHFHEVGSLDALADIAGVCLMLERLSPERIVCSPVTTGFGQVRCAHGILPVPAPATAYLLRGIPSKAGRIQGELCTPTGAALLRCIVDEFAEMPTTVVEQIGYGMGKKDFEAANCVRAMLGTQAPSLEEVCELRCNLDDMTGEAIGYAVEQLLNGGALDAFCTPIQMKKSRPAVLLTCLCSPAQRDCFVRLLFLHTSTLGVRETLCRRAVLTRTFSQVQTPYGEITVKAATGFGVHRRKVEFDTAAAAATAAGVSLETVSQAAIDALSKR